MPANTVYPTLVPHNGMSFVPYAEFSAAFPWFFPLVAFVFGACVGSFLNVVIYRLPHEQSVVSPGSHCACGQPIRWYDNIPILSWLILRGRARCCGRPFSIRYPFVELLTGASFVACWLRHPPLVAICGALFVSALIAATFIDLDHLIIPDVFTIGLALVGLLLSFWVPALHGHGADSFLIGAIRSATASAQGLLVGSGVVLWILILAEAVLKKEGMGFGDVKFLGAIGAFCGWKGALFAIFGGAMVGVIWLGLAWLWQKASGRAAPIAPRIETEEGEETPLGFGAHVPFGPMLAIAGGLYFLFLRPAIDGWFEQVAVLF